MIACIILGKQTENSPGMSLMQMSTSLSHYQLEITQLTMVLGYHGKRKACPVGNQETV